MIHLVQLIQYLDTIRLENKQETKRNTAKTRRAERVLNFTVLTEMSSPDELVVTLKGSQNVSIPRIINSDAFGAGR